MGRTELSIGQVAELIGVRTSKIRYYESVGLLPKAPRNGGRRMYRQEIVDTLALIQFAQDAGFSIPEIRHVLSGFDRTTPPSKRWQEVARRKLHEVTLLIERTTRMQSMLENLLACQCVRLADCVHGCNQPNPLPAKSHRNRSTIYSVTRPPERDV